MSYLLLAVLLSQADVLDNEDLLAANQPVAQLKLYQDNELLYDEKQSEALKEMQQHKGRRVRIQAEVERVTREAVHVWFFGKRAAAQDEQGLAPQLRFVESEAREVKFFAASSRSPNLGGTTSVNGNAAIGQINIGELISKQPASKLRKGDKLTITGVIKDVRLAPAIDPGARKDTNLTAGFVIEDARVEKSD